MKKQSLFLFFYLIVSGAFAQFPQIKWWFDTNDSSFGQSTSGDIDKDGKPEIVFGCYRNDSMVYVLNAEDGSLLWKYNTHSSSFEGCNDVAPILYDVDMDDSLEVIVPSSCNPRTFCFRGASGQVKWSTPTAGSDSPPAIADLDGDGKPELLHGGFDGKVMCINAENGTVAWTVTLNANSWVQTAPTIVDLDSNGQVDFVAATWAFGSDTSRVHAYRGDNHTLLWKRSIPDVMYHGSAVADLDNDMKPELVIGAYDGKVYALNGEDGSIAWNYQAQFYVGAPAVIADLDKDGNCEIVYCDAYGVGALTNAGAQLWYYDIPNFGTAFRGVAVADIDGDEMPDLCFGTSNGNIIVLHGADGTVIWGLNLAAHYGSTFEIDHAPLVDDFDGDGNIDVFIVGGYTQYPDFSKNYGRAYLISAGTGLGPAWTMFQRDIRRQSSTCSSASSSLLPESFAQAQYLRAYPNPGSGRVIVETPKTGRLRIVDAFGRTAMEKQTTGLQTELNISHLPAGLYRMELRSASGIARGSLLKE